MAWAGGIAIGLIIGLVIGGILMWWWGSRRHEVELAAARARADAEVKEAILGRDVALADIERKYRNAIDQLDEKQAAEAERLRDDPGARADLLARVIAGKRGTEKVPRP